MKRFLGILLVLVITLTMVSIPAMSEFTASPAFVKVTECTLRRQPIDDTSEDNRLAKLENGYTMTVVGESDGYYCVQPSSVCDRVGASMNLPDFESDNTTQLWGFVKKGHVKLGQKQFVETQQYAIFYDEPTASDEFEIGEKAKGTYFVLMDTVQDGYGNIWYKVQLNDTVPGAAYVESQYAIIQDGTPTGYVPQDQYTQADSEIPDDQPTQPEQEQTQQEEPEEEEPEEEEPEQEQPPIPQQQDVAHSQLFNQLGLTVNGYATVSRKKLSVQASPKSSPTPLGTLRNGERVLVLGESGKYTQIDYNFNGKKVIGYVLTEYLTGTGEAATVPGDAFDEEDDEDVEVDYDYDDEEEGDG